MSKKAYIPATILNRVFNSFDGCVACGSREATECGHLVAEARGGAMVPENFVRLCGACNRTQGTASVAFAAYAPAIPFSMSYGDALTLISTRRAYWAKYCRAARGQTRVKPYRPIDTE